MLLLLNKVVHFRRTFPRYDKKYCQPMLRNAGFWCGALWMAISVYKLKGVIGKIISSDYIIVVF